MAKKYKWYKDLWGWIGAIILTVINIMGLAEADYFFQGIWRKIIFFPALFIRWIFQTFDFPSCVEMVGCLPIVILGTPMLFIVSFIIGILLHKLSIKLKWVKN